MSALAVGYEMKIATNQMAMSKGLKARLVTKLEGGWSL